MCPRRDCRSLRSAGMARSGHDPRKDIDTIRVASSARLGYPSPICRRTTLETVFPLSFLSSKVCALTAGLRATLERQKSNFTASPTHPSGDMPLSRTSVLPEETPLADSKKQGCTSKASVLASSRTLRCHLAVNSNAACTQHFKFVLPCISGLIHRVTLGSKATLHDGKRFCCESSVPDPAAASGSSMAILLSMTIRLPEGLRRANSSNTHYGGLDSCENKVSWPNKSSRIPNIELPERRAVALIAPEARSKKNPKFSFSSFLYTPAPARHGLVFSMATHSTSSTDRRQTSRLTNISTGRIEHFSIEHFSCGSVLYKSSTIQPNSAVTANRTVLHRNQLAKLSPFLNDNSVMRIAGYLKNAVLSYDE